MKQPPKKVNSTRDRYGNCCPGGVPVKEESLDCGGEKKIRGREARNDWEGTPHLRQKGLTLSQYRCAAMTETRGEEEEGPEKRPEGDRPPHFLVRGKRWMERKKGWYL
jgi:hypothetical protein